MNVDLEVADSTDWADTSVPLLQPVEASLRCHICKDFYDAAVITNCLHTFCSSCIRRAISADGKCPACRSNVQEHALRRNVVVQEIVASFQTARPQALEVARAEKQRAANVALPQRRGSKRKRQDELSEAPSSQGRTTRSQAKRAKQDPDSTADVMVVDDSDATGVADDYLPEKREATPPPPPEDGLVACPICNRRMKEEAVFDHISGCTGEPEKSTTKSSTRRNTSIEPVLPRRPAKPPPERLPQLNYSLMKDKDLRNKLQQLGISHSGSKDQLGSRHKEWVNIVNSNADSLRPKSKRELLHELDVWERTQSRVPSNVSAADPMKKGFDGQGWTKQHKSDFEALIANARRGRQKALQPDRPTDTEAADDKKPDTKPPQDEQSDAEAVEKVKEDTEALEPSKEQSFQTQNNQGTISNVPDGVAPSLPSAMGMMHQLEDQQEDLVMADTVALPHVQSDMNGVPNRPEAHVSSSSNAYPAAETDPRAPPVQPPSPQQEPPLSSQASAPHPNGATSPNRHPRRSAPKPQTTTSPRNPRTNSTSATHPRTLPTLPSLHSHPSIPSITSANAEERPPYRRTASSSPVPGFSTSKAARPNTSADASGSPVADRGDTSTGLNRLSHSRKGSLSASMSAPHQLSTTTTTSTNATGTEDFAYTPASSGRRVSGAYGAEGTGEVSEAKGSRIMGGSRDQGKVRKIPMFEVPSEPVVDMEFSGGGGGKG